MQSNLTLTISDLWIERGERDLCKGFSLTVCSGEIIHLAGVNGAGKSSFFKTLLGVISPVAGSVFLNDENVLSYRQPLLEKSLYIGHFAGLKSIFSVAENLRWYFPKVTDAELERVLVLLGLLGYRDSLIKELSAGQARRVALARLWLSEQPIWWLDEPFSSLDTASVRLLENKIEAHAQLGGIVLLTSHQPMDRLPTRKVELSQ